MLLRSLRHDSYDNFSYLALALTLLAATMIISLSSCSGETQDLNDQASTATTKQLSGSAKAAGGGNTAQIPGDTIHESITLTGNEPKNNYETIATVINVPSILSERSQNAQFVHEDRRQFHSALKDYKAALQAKLYCFDRESKIYTPLYTRTNNPQEVADPTAPCRFLYALLTSTPIHSQGNNPGDPCNNQLLCKHNALISESSYINWNYHNIQMTTTQRQRLKEPFKGDTFWNKTKPYYFQHKYGRRPPPSTGSTTYFYPIHESQRLRVMFDTLAFFDSTHDAANLRIFKRPDSKPVLKVILNLAYSSDSNDTASDPDTVAGLFKETYNLNTMSSILFFALFNDRALPKLGSITSRLGGQAFTDILSQHHDASDSTPHPITTAMQTITHLTKVYAQSIKLTTKQPVFKINSLTINGSTVPPEKYAVLNSTIYVAQDVRATDVIKVEYVAAVSS